MKKQFIAIFRAGTLILAVLLLIPLLLSCGKNAGSVSKDEWNNSYSGNHDSYAPVEIIVDKEHGESSDMIAPDTTQKLIRTVSITAQTLEFDKVLDVLSERIRGTGGYVEKQTIRDNTYRGSKSRALSLVARIPADNLDAFVGAVKENSNVTMFDQDTKNVTAAYVDAAARLETLRVERDSLLEMMKSVNTTDNYNFWYTLHNRISEIEQDIASLEATLKNIDSRVNFSTVNIELYEVVELTPTEEPTFGQRISEAFSSSWVGFAEGWKDFTVGFVAAFPTLLTVCIVLGLIALIPISIVRGVRKKRRKQGE